MNSWFANTFPAILLGLATSSALAQGPFWIDKAAEEIQIKNRKINPYLLDRDKTVIRESFPAIQADFKRKGFTGAQTYEAIVSGWKTLRTDGDDTSPFTKASFQSFISKLGRLRIESVPAGALIMIDEVRQDETTDTTKWLVPGNYRISLAKEGFEPREERRDIKEGDNPPIRMTLTRHSQ